MVAGLIGGDGSGACDGGCKRPTYTRARATGTYGRCGRYKTRRHRSAVARYCVCNFRFLRDGRSFKIVINLDVLDDVAWLRDHSRRRASRREHA